MYRKICPKCLKVVEIDDSSVWEGLRTKEDVNCPNCGEFLTSVFTDGIPRTRVIEEKEE